MIDWLFAFLIDLIVLIDNVLSSTVSITEYEWVIVLLSIIVTVNNYV